MNHLSAPSTELSGHVQVGSEVGALAEGRTVPHALGACTPCTRERSAVRHAEARKGALCWLAATHTAEVLESECYDGEEVLGGAAVEADAGAVLGGQLREAHVLHGRHLTAHNNTTTPATVSVSGR